MDQKLFERQSKILASLKDLDPIEGPQYRCIIKLLHGNLCHSAAWPYPQYGGKLI